MNFYEDLEHKALENSGNLDAIDVDVQLPGKFLRHWVLIYRTYAPFMVASGKWKGPTDVKTGFITGHIVDNRDGVKVLARQGTVKIKDAWVDIMQAANHFIWPSGELIRDYIVVLTNAVSYWGTEGANRNKGLLTYFLTVCQVLKVATVPAHSLNSFEEFRTWVLDTRCPLMVQLPRYKTFEELDVPHDACLTAFHKLDNEVVRHCSQMRIRHGLMNVEEVARKVESKGSDGRGVLGYFFADATYEIEKHAPADLFQHRYAKIRVTKADFKNAQLKHSLVRLAQLFMMTGMYEKWGRSTAIETVKTLKASMHRNSIVALYDRNLVNEALDALRGNPRDGVPDCVIEGVVHYGVTRLEQETEAEGEAKENLEKKKSPEPEGEGVREEPRSRREIIIEKLQESRLRPSDEQPNGSGMILPLVLLGVGLFLVIR